jgi:hypothetical protein
MSILDYLLSAIIYLVDKVAGILPESYEGLSANDFSNFIFRGLSSVNSSFNFINNFTDFNLLFILLSIIIFAEILMHFGFKGLQYLIKLIMGRG